MIMRVATLFCCAALTLLSSLAVAEKDDWYPSPHGARDTIGAANNLTAAGVLRAAQLVTQGKTYQLGGVTGRDTPAWGHRNFNLILYPHAQEAVPPLGSNLGTAYDDYLATWLGVGTQIDGFAHFGIDHKYYNGVTAAEIFSPTGALKFATNDIPPIVTRGVLLDMVSYLGGDGFLEAGVAFNEKEIRGAAKAQGVEIEKGDVVIFHTGWQTFADSDRERFMAGEPGLDVGGAEYLAKLGVVAVGADTWGLDVIPNPVPGLMFPAHAVLLPKNGVYVLENIQTAELAADKVSEFLFVLGVPRFEGAVQMVVNPIAIR